MDFMLCASITIHIPSRTVVIGNDPLGMEEMEGREVQESEGSLLFMEVPSSALQEKVEEACLSNAEKEQLTELLDSFSDLFDSHLGHTSLIEHSIDTGDAKPVHLPPYRTSPTKKQLIEDQIGKMLKEGIIEPATGPWAAPVVIVQKPCGEPRFCVDYHGLNLLTVKDSYPLPRVDESLDFLSRGKFLTTINLTRGYWQVSMAEDARPKTAFVSHYGLFQFLCASIWSCAVYLDDIVVASPTFKQHLNDLREVLSRLKSAGLTIKLAKCQFCRSELTFLGYRVCPSGILPEHDKIKAVTDFKTLVNLKQVRQFLGLTGYYRRFIQDYVRHAEPFFALTKNDVPFVWDSACQDAMDLLKEKLTSAPVLSFPDFTLPFFIHCNACDMGLGAALMQRDQNGRDVAVAYASRALHNRKSLILRSRKSVWPSSGPLSTFDRRLARWSLRLQDVDFKMVHKPGSQNKVPDALSRNPLTDNESPMDLLPDYAVIGGLDLRTLPSVALTDRFHVRKLQLDDPITGDLIRKMEAESQQDSETDDCSQYSIQDGLLYFHDPKTACGIHPLKSLKLYAPASLRSTLLRYYHDHPTAGHLGITKTLARLKLRFFWPKMASEVKKYVISCSVCQLTKPSQRKPAGLMVQIRPQKPWEYVGVDFVGPLPRTSSGNAYIIVFVDYFSKWVEIVAVREATAQVASSKLLSEVFSRHGAPTYLISDRGSPFVSDLFERVLAALGTEHRLTTAYHPQTNATERVNRTLKTAIRAYVDDKHTTWDRYIPQICFALRTAPHESTGQTPSMMLYGRELDTSLDLVTQPVWDGMEEPEVSYSEHLRLSLRETHDHARAALDTSHERRKLHYDKRRRSVSYAIGDLVRVKTHPKSDALANFTAKLAPLYSGPYRVTRVLSDFNYRLAKLDTGEDSGVFHVVNMQPFHTWDSCISHVQSVQDETETPYEALEDCQLGPQMSGDQSQDPCVPPPSEAVVSFEDFTDNAHDVTRDDTCLLRD
ncbi:hypothetical protein QTP70_015177 [Hemibagrus guttatus]|uniref:Gypsy retrotransposon integrase-like protein 1 n=1 Tax=Hemibagrus guttatus TaxID=175788 RepID=A0AAE0UJS5_9TELE|nr:hypothetical protein QTP70_015177 [Hemibagrus guttatus]